MTYRHGSDGVHARVVEADKVFGARHEARTHTFQGRGQPACYNARSSRGTSR